MDVPVAIPLQTGVKGASAAQTTAAAILAAKAARESKIWYHPGNLLKAFAKQVSGRYIVETYLAIKEAYELTALTATLLLGAALQLFTTPTQMWDEWRTLAPNNLEFVGLTSGWVILNTLVCIMVCMGVLSIVRLVPEHDNTLRHLVLDRWFIFATPILLLYVAIMMFVICVLGCASFIFGYTVMYGGLIWAAIVFAMVLLFQMAVTEAVFAVNPPTHYVFNSPIDPTRKVHAKIVTPQAMPAEPKLVRVRSDSNY